MSLPKNVQRQLDAAEALQQQQASLPGVEVVTDPSQLLAPAPAEPAPPAQPAAPVPEPAPAPQPAQPAPGENWEARYRSMKGRYDTEVPELQAREKTLSSQVLRLTEQVQALIKATTKPPEAPAVDPRDAQQFGEDMVEMVQRNARSIHDALRTEFGQLTGQFEARIKALEERVVGVTKKTEQTLEDTFYATLDEKVSDWKDVNASQAWLKWLGEIDPVYGLPRQAALDVAFQRQDATRVVNIFKEFKAARKAPPSLESQVAPASGGSAAPSTASAAPKPMLSQKFLTTFYADVAKGRYATRLEEQQRIENEINLAAREGRIV